MTLSVASSRRGNPTHGVIAWCVACWGLTACIPVRAQDSTPQLRDAAQGGAFPGITPAELSKVERALVTHGNLGGHGNFAFPVRVLQEQHHVQLERGDARHLLLRITPRVGAWEFYATVDVETGLLLHPTVATEAPPP